MNLCAIKPIDNIKKGKCKTCLYVWDLFVLYCRNCVVFSDGLTNGTLGHACGCAVVAGIAVAAGMTGGAGGECGEGENEEDVFHIFSLSGLVLGLGRRCVAVLIRLAGAWLFYPDLQLDRLNCLMI